MSFAYSIKLKKYIFYCRFLVIEFGINVYIKLTILSTSILNKVKQSIVATQLYHIEIV